MTSYESKIKHDYFNTRSDINNEEKQINLEYFLTFIEKYTVNLKVKMENAVFRALVLCLMNDSNKLRAKI